MNIRKKLLGASVAVTLGLASAALGATAASAAPGDWTPAGTAQPWFVYSLDDGARVADGTVLNYESGVFASASPTDWEATYQGPSDADGVKYFLSPRGQESNQSSWISWVPSGFKPGTKEVLQPTSSLGQLEAATFAPAKAAGGNYSLGIAFTKNNGVTLVGTPSFTHINIVAGSADWTFVTPTQEATPEPPAGSGDIGIEATTIAAADGDLSLAVPAGSKATLGAAALVNNLSTSTGTLPTFTVNDARVVSAPGWTVSAAVENFAKGSDSIAATNLRIAPKLVTAGTTSTGVAAAGDFAAANAATKFAEAQAGTGIGATVLGADLTFVAPATAPAGTYTSTMTVTVVSK